MSARRGQEEQSPRRRCDSRSKGQSDVIVERGHEPRQTGGPGSWKGNETDCPLEPPDGGVKQLSQDSSMLPFQTVMTVYGELRF